MSEANVEERLRSLVENFLNVAVGQSSQAAYFYLNSSNWQLEDALQLYFAGNDDDDDSDSVPPPLPPRREVLHHASTSSATASDRTTASYLFKPPPGMVLRGSFFMAMEEAAMQGRWLLVNVQSVKEFDSHLLNRDTWSDKALVEIITSQFLFWQVEREGGREGAKVADFYRLSSFPAIMVIDPVTGEKKWARHRMIDASSLLCDLMPFADSWPCEEYKHLNIVCPKHDQEEEATSDHHPPTHETATTSTTTTGWGEEFDDKDENDGCYDDEEYKHRLNNAYPKHEEEELLATIYHQYYHHPTHETATTTSTATGWVEEFVDGDEIGDCYGLNLDEYPTLPEEPVDQNKDMVCKVGIRLPDGRRVQRRFNKSDPIQLLWSFGHTVLDEEAKNRPFRFVEAVPGKSRTLEYEQERTFDEEQLNNTMLSLTLE